MSPRTEGARCGYDDAVRLSVGGSRGIALAPAGVATACPVAVGLAMWEWWVVQPAAMRSFGSPVRTIRHLGSYNCRRIDGRSTGRWSEHAHANAIDIAGFVMANGTRVDVARDWRAGDAKAAFLRAVRDGACPLFTTVLSPDADRAHATHLHLDEADRGRLVWRACR